MSTETLTPSLHTDDVSIPAEQPAPATRRPPRVPRLTRRGAGHLLRSFVSSDDKRSAADPLMVLGPTGGPIFT